MLLRDLSNNNGAAGIKIIQESATDAYYFKATEGLGFKDGLYPEFRAAAAKRGKPSGAYLFLHHDEDGADQARYFLKYAQLKPGDLQPVVDVEQGSAALAAGPALAALRYLRAQGFDPILYSSTSWLSQLVRFKPELKNFHVWQAEYGPVLHRVPGFSDIAWQFTDKLIVGKGPLRSDGSHLFVRSLAALEIPKPKPPVPPAPTPTPAPPVPPAPKPTPKPKPKKRSRYVALDGFYVRVGSRLFKWIHRNLGKRRGA